MSQHLVHWLIGFGMPEEIWHWRKSLCQKIVFTSFCVFHAQQAAEKSIKAVLVHRGIAFPKTHIIERLIDLLPEDVSKIPELSQSAKLSVYATVSRYPGDVSESVDEEEYQEAVRLAEAVVQWAESILFAPDTESEDPNSESH